MVLESGKEDKEECEEKSVEEIGEEMEYKSSGMREEKSREVQSA